MQVTLESAEGLKRILKISVDANEVERQIQAKLTDLSKQVRMPGFRAGKVPMKVMKQRYGNEVKGEVAAQVVQNTFQQAVTEQNLMPVTQPEFDIEQYEEDKPFIYQASFEVLPDEINVTDLSNVDIELLRAQVSEQDVTQTLEKLQRQHVEWQPVERAATIEDQVMIDFIGTIEGEPLENGSATGFTLELGNSNMIAGFEEGIVGMQPNEQKTLSLNFPENYHHAEIAGKPVEFVITLQKVSAAQLPELTDEFAQKFDIQEGGLTKLREEVEQNMRREMNTELQRRNHQIIFDQWLSVNDIEVPHGMVDQEIQALKQQMIQRMTGGKDIDPSLLPQLNEQEFEEPARRRVTLSIMMREYIEQHQLKAAQDKVEHRIAEIAKMYDKTDEIMQWYRQHPQQMEAIEGEVLEQQVVEHLLLNANVGYKDASFTEVMHDETQSA
jgi:trigger factor